jgi:tRNA nucleotidyltransferase (CCA-adding enzyme)
MCSNKFICNIGILSTVSFDLEERKYMQVYLVGGAVRDALLGRTVTERDYVVVGATVEDMLAKGFTQVGKDFPVFLHPKTGEEYALARTERKSGAGYTGFVCDASKDVTLEDDLRRRDFTVNAMAQDNLGHIIDPYHGKVDLEKRCLRHVSEAFSEDPLRVFRGARFAARYAYLGFHIADETLALMSSMSKSGELTALSAERVWQETKRSLLERSPEVYFSVLVKVGALNSWFCELTDLIDEALSLLAKALETKDDNALITRFTSLCIPLDEQQATTLCKRLKVQNQVSEIVELACKYKNRLFTNNIEAGNTDAATQEAEELLSIFNGADAWRRPERFAMLLAAMSPSAQEKGIDWTNRQALISQALFAANNVNVKDIIARGHKGAAIKEALNQEKRVAICNAIENHTRQ